MSVILLRRWHLALAVALGALLSSLLWSLWGVEDPVVGLVSVVTSPSHKATLRRKAVLFGDSHTEFAFATFAGQAGWAGLLQRHFRRKVDISNCGFGGYTTRSGLAILPLIFPPRERGEEPLLFATVFFGSNDAAGDGQVPNLHQHVPLAEYKGNLRRIIKHIRHVGCEHIIVMGPAPVDSYRRPDRSNAAVAKYAATARKVAEEEGTIFVDPFAELNKDEEWNTSYTYDGLHMNGPGNAVLFNAILQAFPVQVEDLEWDLPLWRQMPPVTTLEEVKEAVEGKLEYRCRALHCQ